MAISTHFQQVPGVRAGIRKRVGCSLTCCNKESIKVLGLQSGVGDDRDWHTKLRESLQCQAAQALIHRHAQLEGDVLPNVQPVHNDNWVVRVQELHSFM